MAQDAFDLAEHFQTPVFVMMDLDLGMNNWMADGFTYPDKPINRGKLLTAGKAERARRVGPLQGRRRRRHRLPHHSRRRHAGLLHARVRPQRQGPVQRAAGRLRREHGPPGRASSRPRGRTCRSRWSRWCPTRRSGSSATARRTGRSARAATSCARRPTSRPRTSGCAAYPFTDDLATFIDAHERVYVIEQNRDAQLLQLMKLELSPERQTQAAQRAALQRAADRRPQHHRRCAGAGRV